MFDADELGLDPEDDDELGALDEEDDVCGDCGLPWEECNCDLEED